MNSRKKPYHHGDLRITLLQAATDLIAEGGVESLSIRKLADKAGVSRTAPYHHFKDKNELLCAIAEQGFHLQDQLIEALNENAKELNPVEQFERYVITYIRFADEQRETYDLMYGRDIWKTGEPTQTLQEVSRNSFRVLLNWVEELQAEGVFEPSLPALRIAQSAWASIHGLCRLFNDGIYVNREDLQDIARTSVQLLINQNYPAEAEK
ncbi:MULTISPECIES: TetR/AcrR family transcriptional regulator [unclassified Marinobacterium]|jgi:AcrR family transcriptional regulator|uniref:TetR/AcrR family transcriptional regulator n=1 Tax=unclassified Marinobacterium TaxID=2644139 RepID=UPI001569B903|nr:MULTISPECIES: TetR/AcrR family transcriptional regulator [unclassified Marinobacterium]NRP16047.1 Tetracycline repressor protein class A from transposon [Marinobacterium sp. xm-a-152]NRP35501.1 Tetracycline repressor protein class A from transposon [Marinobacterium sp. xm-d-579]NRP37762.1 Tetracycline repressor protein class A from transposon [Marinobacterium sp. xm-a-121]NRP46199.1 Tetracycline repressor protein class A from transposon [Marinobacterium sp. xm-d-543]NRP52820.1 Tetracycline 